MSDLVRNPEDLFSHNEAHIGVGVWQWISMFTHRNDRLVCTKRQDRSSVQIADGDWLNRTEILYK